MKIELEITQIQVLNLHGQDTVYLTTKGLPIPYPEWMPTEEVTIQIKTAHGRGRAWVRESGLFPLGTQIEYITKEGSSIWIT